MEKGSGKNALAHEQAYQEKVGKKGKSEEGLKKLEATAMAKKLLIDADVFADYLMGDVHAREFFSQLPEGTFYYSPLARLELLSADVCADQSVRISTNALLSLGKKVEIDDTIVGSAAELRRQYNLSITDAVLVAAAINLKAELVTKKAGEFKRIANLLLMKPY